MAKKARGVAWNEPLGESTPSSPGALSWLCCSADGNLHLPIEKLIETLPPTLTHENDMSTRHLHTTVQLGILSITKQRTSTPEIV